VIPGGQCAPLLEQGEGAFDDVALLVQVGVEVGWPPATGAASFAVGLLVGRLGDHRADAALAQHGAVGARGVGLVTQHCIGAGTGPAAGGARDLDRAQHHFQRAPVVALARGDQYRQGPSAPVDGILDLAGQPAAGAPDALIGRLAVDTAEAQIRVIRSGPPVWPSGRVERVACRWARMIVASTEITQSTSPWASASAVSSARTRSQVP